MLKGMGLYLQIFKDVVRSKRDGDSCSIAIRESQIKYMLVFENSCKYDILSIIVMRDDAIYKIKLVEVVLNQLYSSYRIDSRGARS